MEDGRQTDRFFGESMLLIMNEHLLVYTEMIPTNTTTNGMQLEQTTVRNNNAGNRTKTLLFDCDDDDKNYHKKLYFRENEIQILIECFRRLQLQSETMEVREGNSTSLSSSSSNSKVVTIRGESGSGKTTLARIFRKEQSHYHQYTKKAPNLDPNLYLYLEAKFDQCRKSELYSPYRIALLEYLQQLEKCQLQWLNHEIQRVCKDPLELHSLLVFLPILCHDGNENKEQTTTNKEESNNNLMTGGVSFFLKRALRKLINCLTNVPPSLNLPGTTPTTSSKLHHVLVFVLDDIHYADETDLDLLFSLVSDVTASCSVPESKTLFLLTYCGIDDDDTDTVITKGIGGISNNHQHNFFMCKNNKTIYENTLDKIQNEIDYQIQLKNLSETQIHCYLQQHQKLYKIPFQQPTTTLEMFCTFVWKKTNGNFFYMVALLQWLKEHQQLRQDNNNSDDIDDNDVNNSNLTTTTTNQDNKTRGSSQKVTRSNTSINPEVEQIQTLYRNTTMMDIVLWNYNNNLCKQVQYNLQIASCIGNCIHANILSCFDNDNNNSSTNSSLSTDTNSDHADAKQSLVSSFHIASDYGIVKFSAASNCWYFVHDKVRSLIYQSIETMEEKQRFHYEIGKRLWKHFNVYTSNYDVYTVLDHLLPCRNTFFPKASNSTTMVTATTTTTSKSYYDERTELAKICLFAGELAAKDSAFISARSYFRNGIALLDTKRCWFNEETYELALRLYSGAGECSFTTGFLTDVFDYESIIVKNAKSIHDTIRICIISMNANGSMYKWIQARDTGVRLLHHFGEHFPKQPKLFHTILAVLNMNRIIHKTIVAKNNKNVKELDSILTLPVMTNTNKHAAMQILNFTIAYGAGNPHWPALFTIRMINLTIRYGLNDISCLGFVLLGWQLCKAGNVQKGSQYGHIAYTLYKRFHNRSFLSRFYCIYYSFLYSYTNLTKDCIEPLLYAYQVGVETGDIEFALICGFAAYYYSIEIEPLSNTEQKLQTLFKRALLLEQKGHVYVTDPFLHTIHQLIRSSSDGRQKNISTDDSTVVVTAEVVLDELSTHMMKTVALYPQVLLHYVFGKYEQALNVLSECQYGTKKTTHYPHFCSILYMLEGLSCFGIVREATTTNKQQKHYMGQAKKALVHIKEFTKHGIGILYHFLAMQYIVEAEVATFDNNNKGSCIDSIVEKYDQAITASNKAGSLMLCAFAYELCAKYLLVHCTIKNRKLLIQKGKVYLHGAIDTYSKWGANAKIRTLQNEMEEYGYKSLLLQDEV